MNTQIISPLTVAQCLQQFRTVRPLVHCLTNEVVQEITANVLLAAGASPAMVVCREEVESFVKISQALLVNLGTPTSERLPTMYAAVEAANKADVPWVLDPVAAGAIPWRDRLIHSFLELHPTVVRGNASEIMTMAGEAGGGKGVDSTQSSNNAIVAAQAIATLYHTIVCVTGETDYVTDGDNTLAVPGGSPMATLVVGTGCSLSALVAGFVGVKRTIESVASACALAKQAAQFAALNAKGPGSFHVYYLDGLYQIQSEHFVPNYDNNN